MGRPFLFAAALIMTCSVGGAEVNLWLARHALRETPVHDAGICAGVIGNLPDLSMSVDAPGERLVRFSMPAPPGAFPVGMSLEARCDDRSVSADTRMLTRHPGRPASARRVMVTFPWRFDAAGRHTFSFHLSYITTPPMLLRAERDGNAYMVFTSRGKALLTPEGITWEDQAGAAFRAQLIAPAPEDAGDAVFEVVESGAHFLWVRLLLPDSRWPRIIEVRLDSQDAVTVWGHIQRMEPGNAAAPDLGWELFDADVGNRVRHVFAEGASAQVPLRSGDAVYCFPRAHFERRGYVEADAGTLRFLRCAADEGVAFQESAWRSAAFSRDPVDAPERNGLLEYELSAWVAPEAYDSLYGFDAAASTAHSPLIEDALAYTRRALERAVAVGDDYGNVTAFFDPLPHGSVHGMNRLNHCPPLFFEAWRSGERPLRTVAALWCENMHALSLWWGEKEFGGTRYNNAAAQGETEHANDPHFMWRSNWASHFCTKGFDTFFLAYEETGCPRMLAALDGQVNYARAHIFVDRGEARNIGDVADFMSLYRYTGLPEYREQALRLFRELRQCVGEDGLFSQAGKPVSREVPFIDNDAFGYGHAFGKPYIMGYALSGLPALLAVAPEEEGLAEVVRAVASFMAEAQDPLGGWRYPHPASSTLVVSQGMEHCAQLARAVRVLHQRDESVSPLLDAMERLLRLYLTVYGRTGTVLNIVNGWERAAGLLDDKDIHELYAKPEDRDGTRDYAEGAFALGSSPPEGLAHLFESLAVYLAHRPLERLFHGTAPLDTLVERLPESGIAFVENEADGIVVRNGTPLATLSLELSPGDDCRAGAAHTTTWMDMLERSLTLTPLVLGQRGDLQVSWTVILAPAASEPFSLDDHFGIISDPTSLTVPPLLVWRINEREYAGVFSECADARIDPCDTGPRKWRITLQRPMRGDGPTTTRLFVIFADTEKTLAARAMLLSRYATAAGNAPASTATEVSRYGMRAMLPVFHEPRIENMRYPLAWENAGLPFAVWRQRAREAFLNALLTPPAAAPFAPQILDTEDRGAYEARKVALNLSTDERVEALLLVPHGSGPFPAVLALHDHGAHFTIGKEKVARPFAEDVETLADAQQWVDRYYGGAHIGDALAEQGYVVLAMDALFWGDRGRLEGPLHTAQQELGANLLQLGLSWAGVIIRDDMRAALFLQSLAEVDPERIGCVGLSMGAHRAWNLCAATDIVRVGAAICWLGDTPTLLGEGNNQTRGQSAFSMIFPGLRSLLDYPHVASIACPKPMLFFNGTEDALFPVEGVESAYASLRRVYASQQVEDRLYTRLWPVAHVFDRAMQDEAFAFLDRHLKP